ncbi:MAG: hypothetical protein LBJ00_03860 [Planctomycetaceae bacterium]|nr:hypothetical protein [Planctomycetaceae bacterium]
MNNDTKFIDRLDTLDNDADLKEWKLKLTYPFGQDGTEPESRISLLATKLEITRPK